MTDELFIVELREVPVPILSQTQDHNLTLVRELALVHTADERGVAPARLLWLSQHLDQRYAAFNDAPRQRLQNAIEGDESHVDVRYEVPGHAAEAAVELGAALDEVDEYCRSGDLLTLVTPLHALAFRRWLLGEFVAQIRNGAAPTPWSRFLADLDGATDIGDKSQTPESQPAVASTQPGADSDSGTIAVVVDLDLEGAAGVRGEIANLLDSGVLHLTVDLRGCSFVDSVGISLLLTTRERLRPSGGSIVVTNATGMTKRTLETTGVYDVLTKGT
ncbi:MAG: STAS domain-containing protein [Ilumatobacteraceae bacterium]